MPRLYHNRIRADQPVRSASCNCGAPYVPAGERAAKAVAANPGKSDRAIAKEIGVGPNTVKRARGATVPDGAVERRIGRDGKKSTVAGATVEKRIGRDGQL